MSILSTGDDDQTNAKQLPPSFMYSSILKDIFLNMKFDKKHKTKMINMLLKKYANEMKEHPLVTEFSKEYRPQKAIWWYTRQCFLYQVVNQTLRDLDGATIVDMAPYIVDLHNQISSFMSNSRYR